MDHEPDGNLSLQIRDGSRDICDTTKCHVFGQSPEITESKNTGVRSAPLLYARRKLIQVDTISQGFKGPAVAL